MNTIRCRFYFNTKSFGDRPEWRELKVVWDDLSSRERALSADGRVGANGLRFK
jgi:hypothetical protein